MTFVTVPTLSLRVLDQIPLPVWEGVVVLVLSTAIWKIPQWQTNSASEEIPAKERVQLEDANRRTLIQALGGLFFLVTAYLSWRNLKTAEDKEVNDRFSKAVELLGDDRLEVRLGGIYLLERIAKDSPKDHWTVMEVLTAYVREKSPLSGTRRESNGRAISTDLQAALTVIGRRDSKNDPKDQQLYLSRVNLSQAFLSQANFRGAVLLQTDFRAANLEGTHLDSANLSQANLRNANLNQANLSAANLSGAYLSQAELSEAKLGSANLLEAELKQANLNQADLELAQLIEADLSQTNLSEANLKQANLIGATFSEANLSAANLIQADFRSAQGLTPEQIKLADNWQEALYDDDVRQALGLSVSVSPKGG